MDSSSIDILSNAKRSRDADNGEDDASPAKRPRTEDCIVFVVFGNGGDDDDVYVLRDDDPAKLDRIADNIERLSAIDVDEETLIALAAIQCYMGRSTSIAGSRDLNAISKSGTWTESSMPDAKMTGIKTRRVVFLYGCWR